MKLEEMFEEIDTHLLEDERPSEFLEKASESEVFLHFPFEMLHRMKKTKQSPKYHPEGNVWIHTLMVVDEAAKRRGQSDEPRSFMWAALLHDIGKPDTTRQKHGKITSYNHDREGERLAKEFLEIFTDDGAFIKAVCGMVRYHMQILFVAKKLELAELDEMKKRVDLREISLLGLCDRMGRDGVDVEKEKESVQAFLMACAVEDGELV